MIGQVVAICMLAAISCLMSYVMVTIGLGLEIKSWVWIVFPFIIQVVCSLLVQSIQKESI